MATYTLYGATYANGDTVTKSDVENGTGSVVDTFTRTGSTLSSVLTGDPGLTTAIADADIAIFIRETDTSVESNLYSENVGAITVGAFTPADLFAASEDGGWYEPFDLTTLFQNSDGTTAVTTAGDPVGYMGDKSGNARHATQVTAAARPAYQTSPDRVVWDFVDDNLVITVPAGGWTGTMVLATPEGTAAYGVDIPAGSYDLVAGGFFPGTALTGLILRDGALTSGEITDSITYLETNGGGTNDYGAVTDFSNYWRSRSELTSFPAIDTSSGTDFTRTWQDCSGLTSFPLIDISSTTSLDTTWIRCSGLTSFPLIDTSSVTTFSQAWSGCSSLTSFPLIDTSSGTNFAAAWSGCSSLTTFPAIDTSSGTDFSLAWNDCSSLTSFPAIDTSSGTDFQSAWESCSSLTTFPLIDTSSGTNFFRAWIRCSSLTTFPAIDTSSGTNFSLAWFNCSSLTTFPANMFDSVTATDFTNAFTNTNLNQTSIDNILVSINTSNTSNGTFDQSGGSAPSATGEAAIDALRARGWTVTVTGGY